MIILKEQDGFVQTRQMFFSPLNKLPFFTSEDQKFLMILLGLCILSWLSKILPYILLLVSQLKDSKWRICSLLKQHVSPQPRLLCTSYISYVGLLIRQANAIQVAGHNVLGSRSCKSSILVIVRFAQAEGLTREHILAKRSRTYPNNYSQCGYRTGTKSFLCDPILSNRRNPISMEDAMSPTK